jgi:hypothetical protein
MVEQADTSDLNPDAVRRAGSIPARRTWLDEYLEWGVFDPFGLGGMLGWPAFALRREDARQSTLGSADEQNNNEKRG